MICNCLRALKHDLIQCKSIENRNSIVQISNDQQIKSSKITCLTMPFLRATGTAAGALIIYTNGMDSMMRTITFLLVFFLCVIFFLVLFFLFYRLLGLISRKILNLFETKMGKNLNEDLFYHFSL